MLNKCGLNASRSDSGVISSSVSESALSADSSGSRPAASTTIAAASLSAVSVLAGEQARPLPVKQQLSRSAAATAAAADTDTDEGSNERSKQNERSTQPFKRRIARNATENAKRKEREARSIAIEKAYVHDVYEQISQHISDNKYRAWPRVKQFLQDLEPGSMLCDVGKSENKRFSGAHFCAHFFLIF